MTIRSIIPRVGSYLPERVVTNQDLAAGIDGSAIDMVIVCTATPDQTFPATAARVQAALCRPGIPAFDLQAVCSGFVYGLATVDNFMRAGQAKNALLIGAETFSRILDW